ncbi:competence protein ComGD [Evansella caseinilytica]|uniref:Competence protein ComGD n=1 Tax=Evansella caseinilytica TaxID=1503961 RepID=A0A1H3KU74_9BACI|nr:competence type IV pilus minor pilin ComGD [Evansella caseinilytica]SDY55204.1 competence protein ComGD [Evansella caseinilytica]
MSRCNNQSGYTLLEMIGVVFLLSAALLVCFPMFQQVNEAKHVQYFFKQLELDLYEGQMTAILDGTTVALEFSNDGEHYTVKNLQTSVKKRPFPKGMTVVKGTLDLNGLRFLPAGTISGSGTLKFYHKQDVYSLVLQFVRGRFYVEKNGGVFVY